MRVAGSARSAVYHRRDEGPGGGDEGDGAGFGVAHQVGGSQPVGAAGRHGGKTQARRRADGVLVCIKSMDLGAMTASTVLGLYLDGQQEGNELIMLSELQVSF